MAGLYYEEFTVGRVFEHAWTRTVTEMDNVLFSSLTMNVQPLHLDEEFASKTEFGQRIVNSLFTLGLMIGITVNDTTLGTTDRQSRHDRRALPKPVFHGDTVHGCGPRVVSLRESKSRPDAGIVEFAHTAINQRGEIVAECTPPGADAQEAQGLRRQCVPSCSFPPIPSASSPRAPLPAPTG